MLNLRHIIIADSLGRKKTLANNPESFVYLSLTPSFSLQEALPHNNEKKILLLGLGPSFDQARHAVLAARQAMPCLQAANTAVYWLECPDFEQALHDTQAPLPSAQVANSADLTWLSICPDKAIELASQENVAVLLYRQNIQLFPEFWGPLLARLRLAALHSEPHARFWAAPDTLPSVFLPGSPQDLLHLELDNALRAEGYTPLAPPSALQGSALTPESQEALVRMAEHERPAFFLSVNLRGLDPAGDTFYLLRALNIPVAVWFVDNPWHILSALRSPWWKQAALFVTDPSFLSGLRAHGAKRVFPLPLASSPFFENPRPTALPAHIKTLFVGRSSFPDRNAFFAAHSNVLHHDTHDSIDKSIFHDVANYQHLPHFHDLVEQMKLYPLWPGHDVRRAGAAAEHGTLSLRAAMLYDAAALGLAVVGDDGWKPCLQQCPPNPDGIPARLFPPVDYYTTLPSLYRAAPYSLNATSLLLPGGLTQRHFDVWQAGGFLLSAANSGLTIFPDELARPITFAQDYPLAERVAFWDSHPLQKREIQQVWHDFIQKEHTYRHRIRFIQKNTM